MSNVYVGPSRISGTGVFAARRIEAGEFVFSFAEGCRRVVTYAETIKTPRDEGNYVQIEKDRYLLPVPPSLYINHSCDPNTGVKRSTEVITLTAVNFGDELTLDYSTTMAEDGWEMTCQCGSAICRGRVRDFKYLPRERQLYYLSREVVGEFCQTEIAETV